MNATYERKLNAELDKLREAGTYKSLRHLTTPMDAHVRMEEAGDVVVLSSNNYLGLADNPEVVAAGVEALAYRCSISDEEIALAGAVPIVD